MNCTGNNRSCEVLELFFDPEGWVFYQLKMLKHRPRLFWHRLWIRKDESHYSLSMDLDALMDMNEKDSLQYRKDLIRRRNIAHQRDIDN